MAQFGFLGTWEDAWLILAAILQIEHIKVIPDHKFDRPEPTYISILDDEAKSQIMELRNVFLWSTKFSRFAPAMVRIDGGVNSGKYYLDLADAGPGLRVTLPACYEKNGLLYLAVGCLCYAGQSLNPETRLREKPTPELRSGYHEVKAKIRPYLTARHEFRLRVAIGHYALRLLRENKARIAGLED